MTSPTGAAPVAASSGPRAHLAKSSSPGAVLARVLQGPLTPGQQQFGTLLAKYTGLDPRVIGGWMLSEESSSAAASREKEGNHNWLNIGYFDSGPGSITADKAFTNPATAAKQTAAFLKGTWGGASSGIKGILSTAKKSPAQQIAAIAGSGWASSGYNGGASLVANAQQISTKKGRLPGTSTPYVYPFSKGISVGRTDMGIDPSGPGVIRAIGRAQYLGMGGAGWPTEGGSGQGPVYKLLKGPLAGKKVYTYEGITPAKLTPGQILKKGQPIARSTGSSFETGFAKGRAAGFQPLASDVYSEGDVTKAGTHFRNFVQGIESGGVLPAGAGGAIGRGGFPVAPGGTGGSVGGLGTVLATGAPSARDQRATARSSSAGGTPITIPFAARAPLPDAFRTLAAGGDTTDPNNPGGDLAPADILALLAGSPTGARAYTPRRRVRTR